MQGKSLSFTSCSSANMKWLFWISLLLINLQATESTQNIESCLSQPDKVIWGEPGQSAVLSCTVDSDCSGISWHYEWFSFQENFHFRLNLSDNPLKFSLDEVSLHISSLHTNDSGVYYCAAFSDGHPSPSSQHVGLGTTLIVKGNDDGTTQRTILLLTFILLSIYNLALVTLIVKKYGCRRSHKTDKNMSRKKKQFHDVLQEMSRRGCLKKPTQTATSTDITSTFDDIYQNI